MQLSEEVSPLPSPLSPSLRHLLTPAGPGFGLSLRSNSAGLAALGLRGRPSAAGRGRRGLAGHGTALVDTGLCTGPDEDKARLFPQLEGPKPRTDLCVHFKFNKLHYTTASQVRILGTLSLRLSASTPSHWPKKLDVRSALTELDKSQITC